MPTAPLSRSLLLPQQQADDDDCCRSSLLQPTHRRMADRNSRLLLFFFESTISRNNNSPNNRAVAAAQPQHPQQYWIASSPWWMPPHLAPISSPGTRPNYVRGGSRLVTIAREIVTSLNCSSNWARDAIVSTVLLRSRHRTRLTARGVQPHHASDAAQPRRRLYSRRHVRRVS